MISIYAAAAHTAILAAAAGIGPAAPTVIVRMPDPGYWPTVIAILGTLGGAVAGAIGAHVNSRALQERNESRQAEAARRRIKFLLLSEFATYGPYAGGISLRDMELLESAHSRLRERWNDDSLILAFDAEHYAAIDGTVNQSDRTIARIKVAVEGAKAGMGKQFPSKPEDIQVFVNALTLSYLDEVETTFSMFERVFQGFDDAHLTSQASYIRKRTNKRKHELQVDNSNGASVAPPPQL